MSNRWVVNETRALANFTAQRIVTVRAEGGLSSHGD